MLIDYGANPCCVTKDQKMTPLHLQVFKNSKESNCKCINILCHASKGTNMIDAYQFENLSAIHLAILNENAYVVKQLLDCGANPTVKAPNGYRPLHLACQWGSKLILSHIIIGLLENS